MTIQEILPHRVRARDLVGEYWFNGNPVLISEMQGNVVLLDFWDYSSTESLRTLPYVLAWSRRYRENGLSVVGVHTPRFQFGSDPGHVQSVIEDLGIDYPVMTDNTQLIWSAYGNRSWPTKHLIDKDGFIRCQNLGEGGYTSFERAMQHLLYEARPHGDLPDLMEPLRETDRPGAICFRATPEVLAGYLRGSIGNVEGTSPESVVDYADPGLYHEGRLYLKGAWRNERECFRWEGEPGEQSAIVMRYRGIEANVVLEPPAEGGRAVTVLQDGHPLTPENAGKDVHLNTGHTSRLNMDIPRSYNMVRNREFGDHVLELVPEGPGCAVYALTGVTAVIPELFGSN